MNGIRTQKGLAAKLLAAAVALAAAIGIIMPMQNAWAEGEGDFTLTVQKHWTDKDGNAIDVPFDRLVVEVQRYYKVTNSEGEEVPVNLGDPEFVELTKSGEWKKDVKLAGVEPYAQFKYMSEVAYIGDNEVKLPSYGLLPGDVDFTFERPYENATPTDVRDYTTCANLDFNVPGSGFVLIKQTDQTYAIWMPYLENLTESAKQAIVAQMKIVAGNDKKNFVFAEGDNADVMEKAEVTFLENGETNIKFDGKDIWAMVWYGGFSFDSNSGTLDITNPIELTSVPVKKIWNDSGLQIDHSEDSVTVKLQIVVNPETGEAIDAGVEQIVLSEENGWSDSFDNLPVLDASGSRIVYKVVEVDVPAGYEPSVDEEDGVQVITNTLTTTDVVVSKTVAGNMANMDKEFCFEARVLVDGAPFAIAQPAEDAGYRVEGNTIKFELFNDEKVVLKGIPLNATIEVKETNAEGYSIRVVEGLTTPVGRPFELDAVFPRNSELESNTYSTNVELGLSIDFLNYKEVDIDTGVSLMDKPHFFALIGLALAALAAAAVVVSRKRFLND